MKRENQKMEKSKRKIKKIVYKNEKNLKPEDQKIICENWKIEKIKDWQI